MHTTAVHFLALWMHLNSAVKAIDAAFYLNAVRIQRPNLKYDFNSRVDTNTFTMGNPMPESTLSLESGSLDLALGFWWPKFVKIFKIAIYLSLVLHEGRPSYRENPSALKREHRALFVGNFALLDPHPDPAD